MTAKFNLDDKEIRASILNRLYQENSQESEAVIIEELDLCLGEARIDLAVIKGTTIGIEIKSDKDSLERLGSQILTYNKIFDFIEIVVGETHQKPILKAIPDWWGVSVIGVNKEEKLVYKQLRKPSINKKKDLLSVLQLLWKNEALLLLETINLSSSFKNKTRETIWEQLLKSFSAEELFDYVNRCLKTRQNWRFVHQLK
jgi:hypothetical protein